LDASLGRFETFAEFQLLLRSGDVVIPKVDFREPLLTELEHFAECVASGRTPDTDGVAGLSVVRALEMAQAALDESRTSRARA
jgi:predicted dehydrogenase